MDKRKAMRLLQEASRVVNREISEIASSGGRFAAGLAPEGYAGGYRDALQDAILLLNGTIPHRRDYWYAISEREERRTIRKDG